MGTIATVHPQPGNIAPASSGMTALATGRGPALVLVHGALGDYRQWDSIVGRMRPHFGVVAISRRFHWPNDPPTPTAEYSVESQRNDLLALVRSIAEPVHLVGHSYGAIVVLSAALAEPSLVGTLTLIEPPLPSLLPESAPELAEENASRVALIAALRANVAAGDDAAATLTLFDWIQGGVGGFAALPEASRHQLLENAKTIGPTYATPPPHFARSQLARLSMATLILSGADTRPFYRLSAQAAAACIAGSRSGVIRDARHMVIVENPDATATAMLDFLMPA
jgi:pimeloyl-ACP methyl ester carboxylesterase